VMAALAKKPEDRYRSAAESAVALESLLQADAGEGGSISLPTPIPPVPVPDPAPSIVPLRGLEKPRTPWLMLGIGVALAVGGAIALFVSFGSGS